MKTILKIFLVFVLGASIHLEAQGGCSSGRNNLISAGNEKNLEVAYRRPFVTDLMERVLRGMENRRIKIFVA